LHSGWCEGIGIANCRERLRVLYGATASLDIANDADGGVVASICLPVRGTSG
jgi:sensor histidine kinase YesM